MNQNTLSCPTQPQLVAFVAGRLSVAESTAIEQHLEDCESCCQLLKMLPDEDTLVSLLRDPQAETANEGEQRPLPAQYAATMPPTGEQLTLPPSDGVTEIADAAERDAKSSLPEPLRDHSRYRITEILGRGGMGDVYKAHHRMMNRPVALKVINAQLVNSHAAVQRFHREVQAAARLTHPNIVTAFDAEQAGDTHYLVMEYVDGVELADVIKDRGPLPVAEACDYVRQTALGLQHAHEQGMVHRDIKPQNLMLTSAGVVKILDFGLANLAGAAAEEVTQHEADLTTGSPLDRQLTQLGSMMGTPDYMAPEQADDAHSADIRADIYSLGCTLYCLLAGKAPFSEGSVTDKVQAHSQQAARPLSEIRNDVPAELEAVIARMMNKSPAERYQVPMDVAKALAPFVGTPSAGGDAAWKPKLKSEPSSNLPLAIVVTLALGFFIAMAGVIVVATKHGRMVIQSEVGDVQVVVKQNGEEIATIDTKTGTQVKWLSTGEYTVELVGDDNDVKLDKTGFQLTRLGTVIVTARWNGEGAGVIRSFTTDDPTISQDNIEVADGGWKITATETQTVRLFESPMPEMNPGPFFYRAKLKTENVKGRAYLEMWVRFPGQGEFFSKGFHLALTGTNGWAEYEIPFLLEKGQQPDQVKLNLTIEGSGTVWIKDVEVRGRTQTSAATVSDYSGRPVAELTDHDRLQGAWTCVEGVMSNKALTKEQLATVSMKFDHDQVELAGLGSETFKLKYALAQWREPKWIEFINPDSTADEKAIAGIYAFDGDSLQIAFDDADRPRPRDFTPTDQHDHFVGSFRRATSNQAEPTPTRRSTGILTSPPHVPADGLPVGKNLIADPSLEDTSAGALPQSWSAWLNDGPDFKCEVVEGGVTGKHCLQISGTGTRGVVFATSIPLDRTKRYALNGHVKVQGEAGAWAVIKLNYFNSSGWLGVDDRVGVTTADLDWKLFEKTDLADQYPAATLIVPTCHIEGNGTAWFDDLEVIAYDRETLPANFDATHGKNNHLTADLDFDRWVGRWESTTVYKPTVASPNEQTIKGEVVVRKILDDKFLFWQFTGETGDPQYTVLLTLDPYVGGYHIWLFGSGGEAFERTGQWDAASQTLTMQVKRPSNVNGSSTDRFVNNDRIESTLLIKSTDGQVTRDMAATWVRNPAHVDDDIALSKGSVAGIDELALLNKMAGDWTIRQTNKPSIWFPDGHTETVTERTAWAIGGRYLMFRSYDDKQKISTLALMTYEPKEKSYHYWHFASDVFGGQWQITWDASSRGFHWRSIDMPTGWIGTGFNRWINDDTFDNQALIKDEQGRVLLDSQQEKKRKK